MNDTSESAELSALFDRDLTRLMQELEAFPHDEDLWAVERGITNSAGHLTLHLEGNLREYVGRLIGGVPFVRDREAEFASQPVPRVALIERIGHVRKLVRNAVGTSSEKALATHIPEDVLGMPMTNRQFLIHLHGHLNYHLGQIDYLRRMRTGAAAIDLAPLRDAHPPAKHE